MDNPKKLTVLSLCTGYGGIEIGLERIFGRVNVLAHVEIEAFAIANLAAKMEQGKMVPAPIWTNVKTFNAKPFRGCVDILTGGYPCQPFSTAGRRLGEKDPRHLWPHIRRLVSECRPRWCFFENVEGHLSNGIVQVLADLEELGYKVEAGLFSAAEVGAPHQRKRVFILAKSCSAGARYNFGQAGCKAWGEVVRQEYGEERTVRAITAGSSEELADTRCERQEISEEQATRVKQYRQMWPARPGEPQYEWEEPRVVNEKLNADWVESLQGVPIYATMITTDINGVIMEAINEIGCEKCRKILFELWSTIGAKEVWPEIGRISEFPPSKVLRHEMYGGIQNNRAPNEGYAKKTCSKNPDEKPLRKMWYEKESTKTSSGLLKARIDNDALSGLSQECPSCLWLVGEIRTSGIEALSCLRKDSGPRKRGREKGFLPDANLLTKMWMGVKASQRVDRLRLLGNGVVPQTAEKAFRVLYEKIINQHVKE